MIPTVSNGFFMESRGSARIEKVDIIQLACNGFIKVNDITLIINFINFNGTNISGLTVCKC